MKKALLAVSVLGFAAVGVTSQAANKTTKKMSQYLLASNSAAAGATTAVVVPKKGKKSVKIKTYTATSKAVVPKVESQVTAPKKAVVSVPVPAPMSGVVSVATTVKSAEKKFEPGLKFSWISLNQIDLKTVENFQKNVKDKLDTEVSAWEQPTLSYQFTKTSSFGITPQFFHTWFGNTERPQDPDIKAGDLKQGGAFFMGDIGLSLKQKELAKFNGTTISGTLRYDLPTSERSQAANTPGSAWGMIDVAKSVGKWDFALNLWTRFYFQNYLTSTLRDEKDQSIQNPMFRDYVITNFGYNFTKKLNLTLQLGVKDTISYGDGVDRDIKYSNNRLTDLSVTYAFDPAFSLCIGLTEELGMRSQKVPFNIPFDASNEAGGGQVYLATSFSI